MYNSVYMQSQRINITLPEDLAVDLRKIVPSRSRSRFIAEILKEKLQGKKNLKGDLIRSLKAQGKITREIQEEFKYADAQELAKLP